MRINGQLRYCYVSTLAIREPMSIPRMVMTPEELSCVLKQFVTSRSWLVCDESAKVSESKLQKGNALKHVALMTALHEHSLSLVFTRSVMSAALKQVVVGMSQDSSKDWVDTMTNRLQNLCRTVSQSLRKNPRSEFAATFPWRPTTTDTAAELGYIVGYDRELRLAWRRMQDGTGPTEMSSPLFLPGAAQPTDSSMARWSDGFEHTVTDITCGCRQQNETCRLLRGRGSVARANIECSCNGDKIETLLMSLFEQGPRIYQTRVDTFGHGVTIAEPAAAKFMTKLGKLYCDGGVDNCNLKQQRDEWLQAGAHEDKSVVQPVFIRQPLVMCTLNWSVFMTFCMMCFGVLS